MCLGGGRRKGGGVRFQHGTPFFRPDPFLFRSDLELAWTQSVKPEACEQRNRAAETEGDSPSREIETNSLLCLYLHARFR